MYGRLSHLLLCCAGIDRLAGNIFLADGFAEFLTSNQVVGVYYD